MQFPVKFWIRIVRAAEVRTLLASTFCCASPLGFSWISKSQVRSPTTSPQAGLYITKLGRWIYSSSLHLPPYWCSRLHIYEWHTVNAEREQRSFSKRQKLGRSVWSGFIEDASKSGSKSNLLPQLGSSPLIGGWSTLCLFSAQFDPGAT